MNYLISHDVGTGGDKAVLATPEGNYVASEFEPYETQYPQQHWAEQNPQDWWRAVARATRRLMEDQGVEASQILAITFASQMLGVLPVDRGGLPLRPAIIWLDGRAIKEARSIMRKVGGPAVFARLVGVAMTGKDVLPKLLWLKRNEPGLYSQTAAFLDVGGYLLHRTTGKLVYEWTGASVTGLFNLKKKAWDTLLMRLFGLERGKFPQLVQSTQVVGGLTGASAEDCGLLEGTPVIAGAGDAPAAAVGSGAVGEGDGHIALGTSGWVGVVTSRRVTGKRGIATIQSADPDKLFLIAETETVGTCLEWAARELYPEVEREDVFAYMDAQVAEVDPGSEHLLFTPWMYGERCPIADECVRAAFLNLSHIHRREHMTRAIYEGVAYNLRWMLESVSELYSIRPDPLRVIGGGARGHPWLRIISDVTGRNVESIPHPHKSGALGAALLAAVGLGLYPSVESLKPLVEVAHAVHPEQQPRPVYDEMYASYRQVYRSLKRLYRDMNVEARDKAPA